MKKFMVGAFKDGAFSHWASGQYDSFQPAFEYCSKCIQECAPATGMRYRVVEVEI